VTAMDTGGRWAGLCLVGSGVLTLPTVTHPDILEIGLAEASTSPFWTPLHVTGLVVVVLSLGAVAGLALVHRGRWGRLGVVGVAMTVVGLVATAGVTAVEAIVFPVLARTEPALLDFDGPIAGAPAFWVVAGTAVLWFLGEAVVGVATARAGVLPRAPALLLAAAALGFAAFEGPFVPVLGQVAVVAFAAAQIWLGSALLGGGQSVPKDSRSSGSSRSRSSAEMR
jgi:hypothetical protein